MPSRGSRVAWPRTSRRGGRAIWPNDAIQYLILDGWFPKVRIGKRRVRVPVLVTLGVRADGERVILDVRLAGDESTAAWRDVIRRLVERHVGTPPLAIIDGSAGLAAALREQWPTLPIQRCTTHKLRNLEAKTPVRLREELAEDYRRMIYAESRTVGGASADPLRPQMEAAVSGGRSSASSRGRRRSIHVPGAFRRRSGRLCAQPTPSSASTGNSDVGPRRKRSLPSQDAVLLLLFGLLRSGQVKLSEDRWLARDARR